MPPCTAKRTTTNLKIKNNKNYKKTPELYGSLTNKELSKKHSSRSVGEVETGREDSQQRGSWKTGGSHIAHR